VILSSKKTRKFFFFLEQTLYDLFRADRGDGNIWGSASGHLTFVMERTIFIDNSLDMCRGSNKSDTSSIIMCGTSSITSPDCFSQIFPETMCQDSSCGNCCNSTFCLETSRPDTKAYLESLGNCVCPPSILPPLDNNVAPTSAILPGLFVNP